MVCRTNFYIEYYLTFDLFQDDSQVAGALTFWLANVSELLHFIQCDRDIMGVSQDAQDILNTCVQNTFR